MVVVEALSSAPSATDGLVYYNTTTDQYGVCVDSSTFEMVGRNKVFRETWIPYGALGGASSSEYLAPPNNSNATGERGDAGTYMPDGAELVAVSVYIDTDNALGTSFTLRAYEREAGGLETERYNETFTSASGTTFTNLGGGSSAINGWEGSSVSGTITAGTMLRMHITLSTGWTAGNEALFDIWYSKPTN